MRTRKMVVLSVVAALYVVLTGFLAPISFGAVQFRVSEGLNHLHVFHKDYKWAIILGLLLSNFIFSAELGWYDIIFGTLHSLSSFFVAEWLFRFAKNTKTKMIITSLVFTVLIVFVAIELWWVLDLPFWFTYLTTALSELIIMLITAPIMYQINKRIDFAKFLNK